MVDYPGDHNFESVEDGKTITAVAHHLSDIHPGGHGSTRFDSHGYHATHNIPDLGPLQKRFPTVEFKKRTGKDGWHTIKYRTKGSESWWAG